VYQTLARSIMRVEYTIKENAFLAGKSRAWSNTQLSDMGQNGVFDVEPDGKHLLAVTPSDGGNPNRHLELPILLNFFDEVKRRVK
jgi:hypothetical protein